MEWNGIPGYGKRTENKGGKKKKKAQASVSAILGARAMGQGTGKFEFSLESVEIPHAKQTSQRGISRPGTRQPRLSSKSWERMFLREGSNGIR